MIAASELTSPELVVVETYDGKVYLGRLTIDGAAATVRSGVAGRPAHFPVEEISEITYAERHPDVVFSHR